jgi:formylglycine-generating enzyme required for sulfatase activity
MMSAGRNQKALDSVPGEPHANGLFTWELTQVMQTPGIEIREALERVKDRVDDKAKGVGHEQRPGLVSDLRGNFYFFGPTTVQVQGDSTASDPETRTWDAAERVNSVESYQAYLNSYPKGRYVSAAKIAMAGLRQPAARPTPVPTRPTLAASDDPDTALWRAVESGNTTEDYGVYLKQYPKGKYVALAKQRSKRIEDDARAKAEAEEQADWQAAESAQTVESYLAYGARYPSGKYSFLAQTRASKLKNDTQAQAESQDWESARSANSAEAYNGYLARYPSGRYAALAKVAQQRLQREAEDRQQQEAARQQREQREAAQREEQEAWRRAESSTDSATVQRYLDRYPSGPHAEQARTQLAQIKRAEAEMRPGKVFKDCADCPEMVVIPSQGGGAATMAMGQAEVTQGQWQAVMGSNPSHFQQCGSDCPVEKVSWDDAQVFIQKLKAKTGKTYRLPTEQEWEYACLGGQPAEYCGSNNVDAVAWYESNSGSSTHRARTKQANAFGLYDMSGNVWEWTDSCWEGNCGQRVVRGGSWNSTATNPRADNRFRYSTSFRSYVIGFRLARMLP